MISTAKTTQLYFTPCYSPPESFVQDASGKFTFTKAVDVYAFGVLAYWLLNGGILPPQLSNVPPSLPCLDFGTFAAKIPIEVQTTLNRSVAKLAKDRPTATDIRDLIGRRILFNQHRMLLTYNGVLYHLHKTKQQVKLSHQSSSVEIQYDGLSFKVVSVTGYVFRNNKQLVQGEVLSGASVIVLGDPSSPNTRVSMTSDISYPEVLF
jgi:eukaryotic-like serine/threonine-protein kinase